MARHLALAPHRSTTAALLAGAARERGMDVVVLPGDGVPGRLRGSAHYYGGPRFASAVAGRLGAALLEPDDGWLDGLPRAFTGRRVRRVPLDEARRAPRTAVREAAHRQELPGRRARDRRHPAHAGRPPARHPGAGQ
ncbi:hypothetical protein GCM10020227_22370 [Streptomyces flavovirens]